MNTLKITRSDGSIHETVPLKSWRQRCNCECKTGGPYDCYGARYEDILTDNQF